MLDQDDIQRAIFPKLLPYYMNKAVNGMYKPFYNFVDNYYNTLEAYNKAYNNYLAALSKPYSK